MRINAEGTQGAAKTQQLVIQLFRVCVFGEEEMPQRREVGVECMQKPEPSYLPGRHARLEMSWATLLSAGHAVTLIFQNLDQALCPSDKGIASTLSKHAAMA